MAPRTRQIYLVRHAVAEPRGPAWRNDDERPLSADGMAEFRRAVQGLAALDVEIARILTSPLTRTRQTADLLAVVSEPPLPIVLTDSLRPDVPTTAAVAELDRQLRQLQIAVVGHEPGIGALAAYLIGLRRPLPFKKGAVARIDVDGRASKREGTLKWFLPPRVLRRLAR